MNVATEVSLIVARELKKNLRSVKGMILLGLSLLGGTGMTLLFIKIEQQVMEKEILQGASAEQLHEFKAHGLGELLGDETMGRFLADAPQVLLGVLPIGVRLAPLLIALMGFDAISGDIQHRSVRYWTVRTRRTSYFVGKFFGLWAVVSAVTLLLHATIWAISILRGEASAPLMLSWGMRFWLVTFVISAPWCALAALVGSLFRTPILALLMICVAFFALWFVAVIGDVSKLEALNYAFPNYWQMWLLSPNVQRAASGLGVCLGLTAAITALGATLFNRRDV